ncbi:anti-sigma factor [Alkalihalobacillus sp. MEB130]|uniref:anti-sigma factor n=1 Tax=Alkalihalobacillus sp. MEB130 TaxID=2976704 RepID=UPI0028E02AC5|nr:anti sigma factor C-terminal domain-containing protein [Alkalihalobacillus sp. MEB130]MDT8860383.1 anti-sigma factor [Alkalihalobacillus sp. MEB130]
MDKTKWKNRAKNVWMIFLIVIVGSIVSALLTAFYYGFGSTEGGIGEKASQVLRTATQMTMPNVYLGGGGINTNVFFTMNMDFHIGKQLGRENKGLGRLHGKMFFHQLTVNREWADGQYDVKLYFLHPHSVETQPEREQSFYKETLDETFETLKILPEGTVSEVAITFDQLYDLDDVYDLLEGYEFDIVWYAIDTGVEGDGDPHRSPYLSANSGILGFHERSIFDLSGGNGSIETRGEGQKRADAFKRGLHLLAENEKLANRYVWYMEEDKTLEERYHFVEENGVKTYGVVVTGPTKELLALQENDFIIYATLGEVDFWNWYSRPASGTIYN